MTLELLVGFLALTGLELILGIDNILALAFLMLVGMTLVLESFHIAVPKGYMYSAMGFSLVVELLHLRYHSKLKERARNAPG